MPAPCLADTSMINANRQPHRIRPVVSAALLLVALLPLSLRAEEDAKLLRVGPAGSAAEYHSVASALSEALEIAAAGKPVIIELLAGTYRENINLRGTEGQHYAAITIRASDTGQSRILGTRRVDGWRLGRHGTFENQIAPRDVPSSGNLMMFVEGVRLEAVDDRRKIQPGRFFVDRSSGRIHMLPPRNAVVADGKVEVSAATLAPGWHFENLGDLRLEGLEFHGFSRAPSSGAIASNALSISRAGTVEIGDIKVTHSSGIGLRIRDVERVVIGRSSFNRNGIGGLRIENSPFVQLTGVEAQLNGWRHWPARRGIPADAHAIKLRDIGEVAAFGLRIADNRIHGMRAMDSETLRMREAFIGGNSGRGLKWSGQTFAAAGMQIAGNGQDGLITDGDTRLSTSILTHNGTGDNHVQWRAGPDTADILRWSDNIITASESTAVLIQIPANPVRDNHVQAHHNLYYVSDSTNARPFVVGETPVSFEHWQKLSGQDLDSLFADPLFDDAPRFQFALPPQSPWFDRDNWPQHTVDDATRSQKWQSHPE